MEIVLSITFGLLLVAIAMLVGYPLLQKGEVYSEYEEEPETMETKLHDEKTVVMTTINEIEFDYQMNKLAEDDYRVLKNKYRQAAVGILAKEDAEIIDDIELEKEIARAKKSGGKNARLKR